MFSIFRRSPQSRSAIINISEWLNFEEDYAQPPGYYLLYQTINKRTVKDRCDTG